MHTVRAHILNNVRPVPLCDVKRFFYFKPEPEMLSCDYSSLTLTDDTDHLETVQWLATRPVTDYRILSFSHPTCPLEHLRYQNSIEICVLLDYPPNFFFVLISTPGYLCYSFPKLCAYVLFLLAFGTNLAICSNSHSLPEYAQYLTQIVSQTPQKAIILLRPFK